MTPYTWRDLLVVEYPGDGNPELLVVLPDAHRGGVVLEVADPEAQLALGWYRTYAKAHDMTHPDFTAYFNAEWPRRDTRRDGPQAEKWEVVYDALLTEYQARATSLNGLTPPGMTREEFRALWETGPQDVAYARAVQGAFNATEVTG